MISHAHDIWGGGGAQNNYIKWQVVTWYGRNWPGYRIRPNYSAAKNY